MEKLRKSWLDGTYENVLAEADNIEQVESHSIF